MYDLYKMSCTFRLKGDYQRYVSVAKHRLDPDVSRESAHVYRDQVVRGPTKALQMVRHLTNHKFHDIWLSQGNFRHYTPANKVWGIYRNHPVCPSVHTSCPGRNFLIPCPIWIIFHKNIVHDLRMCHDLDPRSYLQGQGHSAHIPKIRVRAITPHCHVGSG